MEGSVPVRSLAGRPGGPDLGGSRCATANAQRLQH